MLSKINLIMRIPSGNIIVVKTTQNNKWEFPSLFSNNNTSTIINSILEIIVNCDIKNIKSINYLFEDIHKFYKESIIVPIMYYEIIIKKHIKLSINNSYFYYRYYSITHLNVLNNKSYDIEKYLNILKIQKKENKDNIRIYNSF